MMRKRPDTATDVQDAFWRGLTDQRVANMWEMADLIGDMSADGREFLRTLGTEENKPLMSFLRNAKTETLTFLTEARPEEIEQLKDGIQYVIATKVLSRFSKWIVITVIGTFVGVIVKWEQVVGAFRSGK